MRPHSLVIAGLLGALLVGCTGNVSGAASDAEAASTTSAVVVIERTTDATRGSRAEGSARFVRVAASSSLSDAVRTIGAGLELPPRGSCATLASLATGTTTADAPPVVELVDVGEVALRSDGAEMRLLPRRLPDVTDVVRGVVYDRATEASLLPAGTSYVVHVAGSSDLAAFDVRAAAPSDASTVRAAGEDAQGILQATGSAVDFTWSAASGGSDDAVYVDIRPSDVRCVFGDVGRGAVTALLFDDAGTLVIHRLHREVLRVPGIDSGEIRFDFARSLAYVRR
jgi:hypothetical protein